MSFDFFRRFKPINYYDEKVIQDVLNSQIYKHDNYAGKGPLGGNLYRVTLPDPSNNYLSKEVYVEMKQMGGYPYIAGVYEEDYDDYPEEEEEEYYYEEFEDEEDPPEEEYPEEEEDQYY